MNNLPQTTQKRVLSVFSLVMINIIAVDSIRNLPMAATYGFALIFLYTIGALFYFVPTALITAELATAWPEKGGMYSWVKRAFGARWGFLVVYLQWIYNIVWYPTILTLIAATVAYIIEPSLVENRFFMVGIVLVTFWGCTLVNCFGMRISSWISTLGAILGTLGPMICMIALAAWWLIQGNPSQISFSFNKFLPEINEISQMVFFTGILYSLLGLEMSSVHALEVKNPKTDFPKALLISAVIIILSLTLASLAIAIIVPENQLDIVTGIIQAFSLFFGALGLTQYLPLVAAVIVIGGICSVATWIIGPTKGLFAAADDDLMPKALQKTNKHGVPLPILLAQGIICTLFSLMYILLPTVKSAYWMLSAMAAILSFLMYAVLFLAAIRLRYVHHDAPRAFKIPGGNWGMWLVAGCGFIVSLFVIGLGFIPPKGVDVGNIWVYEGLLIGGIFVILLPFIIGKKISLLPCKQVKIQIPTEIVS